MRNLIQKLFFLLLLLGLGCAKYPNSRKIASVEDERFGDSKIFDNFNLIILQNFTISHKANELYDYLKDRLKKRLTIKHEDFRTLNEYGDILYFNIKEAEFLAKKYKYAIRGFYEEQSPTTIRRALLSSLAKIVIINNYRTLKKIFNGDGKVKFLLEQESYEFADSSAKLYSRISKRPPVYKHEKDLKKGVKLKWYGLSRKNINHIINHINIHRKDFDLPADIDFYLNSFNFRPPFSQTAIETPSWAKTARPIITSGDEFSGAPGEEVFQLKSIQKTQAFCNQKKAGVERDFCLVEFLLPSIIAERKNASLILEKIVNRLEDEGKAPSAEDLEKLFKNFQIVFTLQDILWKVSNANATYVQNFYKMKIAPQNYIRVLLFLSSRLLLKDQYEFILEGFQNNKQVRRVVNIPDKTYGRVKYRLYKASKRYNSFRDRKDLETSIAILKTIKNGHPEILKDPKILFLSSIVNISGKNKLGESKYEFKSLEDRKNWTFRGLKRRFQSISDTMAAAVGKARFKIVKWFGENILNVKFRHGTLLAKRPESAEKIRKKLLPLDVFNSKHRAKLSGLFVPGHWAHNGIYLGTEEQLKALGIWDDPILTRWMKWKISRGKTFIEGLKKGVVLNTLENTLDENDDYVLMRPKEFWALKEGEEQNWNNKLSDVKDRYDIFENKYETVEEWPEEMKAAVRGIIKKALGYYGKEYGFDFDILNQNKTVCSQLIRDTFTYIPFETSLIAGKHSITPTHVAQEGVPGRWFTPLLMYLNATPVDLDIDGLGKIMGCLLDGNCQERLEKQISERPASELADWVEDEI